MFAEGSTNLTKSNSRKKKKKKCSVRMGKIIEVVKRVTRNPQRSMRKIEKELDVSDRVTNKDCEKEFRVKTKQLYHRQQ